jgi:hypothetical protein
MDFMEGLARSNHANSMLVVVDSFIKCDHFLPLSHPFTAMGVAWLPLAELRSGLLGCLFAELWYNSSPHSAIGRSPSEALYGYPPCHFGIPLKLCMDTLHALRMLCVPSSLDP